MSPKSFFDKVLKFFENAGYARAAMELQRLSDAQLKSAGLSREKLQKGIEGMPWTSDTTGEGPQAQPSTIYPFPKPALQAQPSVVGHTKMAA